MNRLFINILKLYKIHKAAFFFYVLEVLSIMAVMSVSMEEINIIGSTNVIIRCIRIASDAIMIMLPFWFIPRRWRWTALIPIFAVALWSLSSLCYYRFWGKPLELYSIFLFHNFNESLLSAGIGLCSAKDLFYPAVFVINLSIYLIWRRAIAASPNFGIKARVLLTFVTLLIFFVAQCLATRSIARWEGYEDVENRIGSINRMRFLENFNAHDNIQLNGAVVHLAKSVIQLRYFVNLKQELTDAQRAEIAEFTAANQNINPSTMGIFRANRNKNLVLIVVESLNADVIHARANGREVTPTLNALFEAQGSITAKNVVCQVRHGGSGDGQLLINTGLHPVSSLPISTYVYFGDNTYFPSIARTLSKHTSAAIFGDDSTTWNQRGATTSMGFDTIIDKRDFPLQMNRYGEDGNLLHFAADLIKKLRQPFFVELFTVSMHTPFSTANIPPQLIPNWIDEDKTLTSARKKYLKVTSYFDHQLGEFIAALKSAGIYDNTVIAIVSDHAISLTTHDKELDPMLFIVANTGVTTNVDRLVGQVDLFPTILQVMGASGRNTWQGVGTSILDIRLNSVYDFNSNKAIGTPHPALSKRQKDAFRISELIIRGNYFIPIHTSNAQND